MNSVPLSGMTVDLEAELEQIRGKKADLSAELDQLTTASKVRAANNGAALLAGGKMDPSKTNLIEEAEKIKAFEAAFAMANEREKSLQAAIYQAKQEDLRAWIAQESKAIAELAQAVMGKSSALIADFEEVDHRIGEVEKQAAAAGLKAGQFGEFRIAKAYTDAISAYGGLKVTSIRAAEIVKELLKSV